MKEGIEFFGKDLHKKLLSDPQFYLKETIFNREKNKEAKNFLDSLDKLAELLDTLKNQDGE